MVVIALCTALVLLGGVIAVAWGAETSETASSPLRYIGAALAGGLAAGVLAAGAGARLVMRVLALTSPQSDGMLTEGQAIVGKISLGGTIGFIVFIAAAVGLATGALYALLRPLLPPGRAGGLVFGALLLVLAGSRVEPLRADNFDFNLVGPGWLAVLLFTLVALFHGLIVAAVANHLAPRPPAAFMRLRTAGRAAVGLVALLALPGFVISVAGIV